MLALLGIITIILLLTAIMTKRLSPAVALISIPSIMAIIGGFGPKLGGFITKGIIGMAPVTTMFVFAILFFGILTDAGTFNPIIRKILKIAGKDPIKITIGTAILAMCVHLDGSGAVTFLIAIPAMLPIYNKLGMKKTVLATVVALAAGTMNILPWGGPTIRAASSIHVPVTELFNPLLPAVIAGLLFVLFVAYRLGKKEKVRIGPEKLASADVSDTSHIADNDLTRPHLFVVNIGLIIIAIVSLIMGLLPAHVIFMLAFAISLVVNYPSIKEQKERVDAHSKEALLMASILLSAGAFIGIIKGSGMIAAMAGVVVDLVPNSMGGMIPLFTGVIAMPASLMFDPDSFYFGVLPILSQAAHAYGVDAVNVARAAILGQMTTGFPISPLTGATFLLIGLSGVDLADHQRKTIPYAFATTIIMLIVSILIGAIQI